MTNKNIYDFSVKIDNDYYFINGSTYKRVDINCDCDEIIEPFGRSSDKDTRIESSIANNPLNVPVSFTYYNEKITLTDYSSIINFINKVKKKDLKFNDNIIITCNDYINELDKGINKILISNEIPNETILNKRNNYLNIIKNRLDELFNKNRKAQISSNKCTQITTKNNNSPNLINNFDSFLSSDVII